ncbi:MAG: ChbG/HpnK family deacetylase [Chloroflexi bacterium]|nr:MAG: ChbG/HpnK family deacetylase [Chloroflexota bacterium]
MSATLELIFNADDFGRLPAINAAVIRAHREGVLTSASLMVTGDAVEEAVALAHEWPTLAVGLHVVVVAGRAVLSPGEIPHLVDERGYFDANPVRAGLRYFFSTVARQELARELSAQFDSFVSMGLAVSHVDGHLLMHLHPTVLGLLLPLIRRYDVAGFRLPHDDLRLALGVRPRRWGTKITWAAAFAMLCRWTRRRLRGSRAVTTDHVFGVFQSGHMSEAYVLRILDHLGEQVQSAELYFHPSTEWLGEPYGPNPQDLATLLSPAVRHKIQERGMHLTTYPHLRARQIE